MDLKKRPLVAGAAALFLAGVANRIIGTVYRVLLVRTAGEEVVGIFQMTMPVYRLAWTLAAAGLFVAIARLSADALGGKDRLKARRYGRVGLTLSLITAVGAATLLLLSRDLWAHHFLTDPRTSVTLWVLPFLLVPAALSAALRGVLQGQERLSPMAVSSFLEATSRVPVVLFFVTLLLPLGPAWAAGGIAAGLLFGEMISVAYLAWVVRRIWNEGGKRPKGQPNNHTPNRSKSTGRRRRRPRFLVIDQLPLAASLLAVATPVLFSGLLNGSMGMFNVALIPRKLFEAGIGLEEATILYGRLFGMALPALYMPMVAVHPLVHAAMPAVAKRLAQGKIRAVKRLLVQCFFVAITVSGAASLLFFRYGEEIGRLLYGIDGLGELIVPLAAAAPFTYVGHVASGILYGLGRTGIVMVNSVVGNCVRLGLIFALVGDPQWGIVGALWAVVADYAITALLNLGAMAVFIPRVGKSR